MSKAVSAAIERARQFVFARQTAYRVTFRGPRADIVLKDLAKFCRANDSTFHPDARVSDVMIGRREVWLRIQQNLNLSSDDLWKMFGQTGLEGITTDRGEE